jgi:predicted enzyme related to lactoylglutathione lyase
VPTPTHHPGTPVWVDLNVETAEQRERLMDFYVALFGWTWEVSGEEMGHYSIAASAGRPVMGIGQGAGGSGAMVTYFATRDVAASAARASELGGRVLMGPMEIPGTGTMALVGDPTGATHGLWQAGGFEGFGVTYEPNTPGWFDHYSKDPAAAGAYYAALTGHHLLEPEPGLRILADGEQWFASMSSDPEDRPAQWNPIYIVDSLARAREVVTAHGAVVVLEEMPVPGSAITVFVEPVMHSAVTVMRAGEPPTD